MLSGFVHVQCVEYVVFTSAVREDAAPTRTAGALSPAKVEREPRTETGGGSRSRISTITGITSNGSASGNQGGQAKGLAPLSNRGEGRSNQDNGSRRNSDLKNETMLKVVDPPAAKLSDSKVAEREQKKSEANDNHVSGPAVKSPVHRDDISAASTRQGEELTRERQPKRFVNQEDTERGPKRRKGPDSGVDKNIEAGELVRTSDRERISDQRLADRDSRGLHDSFDKGPRERSLDRPRDRMGIRVGERQPDRVERDSRPVDRIQDRLDRDRGEDYPNDRFRDRSIDNFGRERSMDRVSDRATERGFERSERVRDDRGKEERARQRYMDLPVEQPHPDDRFPMQNQPQNLPPPPPIPPNVVPRTVGVGRIRVDEASDVRPVRNVQRLSPRIHEKLDKRRTEDNGGPIIEEPKKRRDDEVRTRKQRMEDRELQALKVCSLQIPIFSKFNEFVKIVSFLSSSGMGHIKFIPLSPLIFFELPLKCLEKHGAALQ